MMPLSASEKIIVSRYVQEADVVHLHTIWDSVNLHFADVARRYQVPYVVSTHGMLDEWAFSHKALKKKAFMRFAGKALLQNAAAVHCTAEGEKSQVSPIVPGAKYFVAPHYFDWSLFQELPGAELAQRKFSCLDSETPKILSLGRLHPVKGADVLIEALSQVRKMGTEVDLVLAGPDEDGYQKQLEGLIERLDLGKHVHFVGMVRGKDKVSLYQACDLFALPTRQENFGIVLAEAMAAKLPLITTPQVDIWPELEQGGGIIVERSASSFAKAISDLILDPSELVRLGINAREFVVRWLDQEEISKQFEAMYAGCAY